MINLIIGLIVGILSAVALVVMWRMAGRLQKELQSCEATTSAKADGSGHAEIAEDHR